LNPAGVSPDFWSVRVDHITDEEALHALDEAWTAFHLAYARVSFSRLHQDEDCLWYESAIGFPVFGGVVRTRFTPADADRRVRELLDTLRGQPHHWFVMPTSRTSPTRSGAPGVSRSRRSAAW
jgi:hypothetical protein